MSSKAKKGSDESRAAEAADLPGTASTEDDVQAEKIKNLRKLKNAGAQDSAKQTVATPKSSRSSKWKKARNVMGVQTALTSQMLELRGLVGTQEEGTATIEDTEEKLRREKEKLEGVWYIILPHSNFKIVWDLAQVAVLLYVAVLVPLRIGFDWSTVLFSTMMWVEVFIDLYFLVDVVLNFVTAYEDPVKRELVTSTREIRRNYMRGFFVIDVLSILPVNYVEWALGRDESGGDNLKTLKILRLVRLTRLLRLARVKKLLKTYTDMLENLAGVFSLLSVCVGAIFLSHFVSCLWYWVGDMDGGWVDITFNCKLAEDPTCVHEYPDVPAGLVQRYLATLWWSLTLLLTAELSNNIQPTNNGEIIFVMLLQLIGAIVFGFIIGTVGTILMSWGLLEERISRKLAELREFMNEKNVPKATRKKVKKFMEDYYRSKAGYDETEVVSALPPAIAVELLDSIYRGTLLKVPIFRHLDEDVICRICLLMKPMTVAKGEYVFNEKDRGREMYIIREGRIQIMRYGMTIGVLHKHCFFGEDCMMAVEPGKKNYRQRTAFAIEDCELAFLRATDADKIALDYPEMLSSFQDLAAKKACVEHERLNMMINQVADELGVDPDSSVMDDVLTAVSTIASEDDVISMEVRAARKIANWWRHTKRRKQGLVKEKFPPVLDMIEERDDDTALKSKIRKVMKTSSLWKSASAVAAAASEKGGLDAVRMQVLKPVPPSERPPVQKASPIAVGNRGMSPTRSNDVVVSLHAMQEQVERMERTQKMIVQQQNNSDLHAEQLDAKLEVIIAALGKVERKLTLA